MLRKNLSALAVSCVALFANAVAVPVTSDHRDEKCKVLKIIANIGLNLVDVGPLQHARMPEGPAPAD